jgi:DNA helicase-2/ATP-dependent DNA helicase PcrA
LLSNTLNNLNSNKALLSSIPVPSTPVQLDPRFSQEQLKAITTSEPLALVQAGAGTGKSTVVLARIQYMIDCGINPADIMVLSFTNAAADHITEKNPMIHSMTIARMIHTIYAANFHGHELSSIDTMMNTIDIYFPGDDFAYAFRRKLYNIWKNEPDSFTRMNNFVERHYDEVMKVLDTIQQTSLEMEIIICYQKIGTLQEPTEVQSKYLIIDEVQDNSIFEFVYTLKYIDKHKESLFIVGDASQTLYEFRASNPKALNVLEGSGVFATHQLQTNYRSNQEILDFANVVLSDIEANQYAHIQLQANSLAPVTAQSFQDKVTLHYERLNKISDFNDVLPALFLGDISKFIDAKIAAGEQVAFLAYTRRHVYMMERLLKKHYPNLNIVNLVPDKMFNSTVMSMFIRKYWDQVQFVPTKSIMAVIVQEIIHYLDFLVYDKSKSLPQIQKMLSEWVSDNRNVVASWQSQYQAGMITQQQFMDNVRDNMLQFEIRRNSIRQSLLSARNQENKQTDAVKNANLILSTIHSAKGLEFENTVVIYKAENSMDEEKKRMYYVALTRAMKSEYVLAYDTVANAKIEADYRTIVDTLTKRAAKNASSAGVVGQSDDDDDSSASQSDEPNDTNN